MMKYSRANLSLTAVLAQQMSGGLTAACDDSRNFRGSFGFDRRDVNNLLELPVSNLPLTSRKDRSDSRDQIHIKVETNVVQQQR